MKISLIIPTYNREELLVQTIKCALSQNIGDYEILVIDQTAKHKPETQVFLDAHRERITLIKLLKPSVTQARNEGLRRSTGDILVFVDDDTTFETDFLASHLDAHRGGIDVVQGRVTEHDSRPVKHPTWVTRTLKFTGGDNYDRDGTTNNITGCNFSITRSVIDRIGYFDENFRGISVREESDYARRAWKAGLKFKFSANAALFHHRSSTGGVSSGIRNIFFDESYYYCELLFCKKHFPKWIEFMYRFRLYLRGRRMLRKLIKSAESSASAAINRPAAR
jgi:glycosyltransferase involved in cell wall biosynthesis